MATERKRNRERRGASSARPRNYSQLYKPDATPPATPARAATQAAVKTAEAMEWTQQYAYVVGDLQRLLIVSGILFALILGAGFIFR